MLSGLVVWTCCIASYVGRSVVAVEGGDDSFGRLLAAVSPPERCRIARFVHAADAWRALCGRLLIRALLQRQASLPHQRLRLGRSKFGKPQLVRPDGVISYCSSEPQHAGTASAMERQFQPVS